jgi:protein TonB
MFQAVVSSRASRREWYVLPLSFLLHTMLLAIVIVTPLMATDVLPTPRSILEYMMAGVPQALPEAPPSVRHVEQPSTIDVNRMAAPVEAPDGVASESGLDINAETVDTRSVTSVLEGFGGSVVSVEPPPPAASAPAAPIHIGGLIKPPARVKDVAPVYPEIARSARVEGIVIIQATIGIDGKVEKAEVLRSMPLLDDAALVAVRAWEYTPTLLNGQPVPVIMTVTVQFKLK